ncbi:hypothetical protein J6590_032371 [Homalodisca vitripennis]|nr:hypothetical protein J6590_032371 [Homalodisca vitripennis]
MHISYRGKHGSVYSQVPSVPYSSWKTLRHLRHTDGLSDCGNERHDRPSWGFVLLSSSVTGEEGGNTDCSRFSASFK